MLEEQAHRGYALACVLSARDLLNAERLTEATRAFRRGMRQRPGLAAHPAVADYLLSRFVGRAGRPTLERVRRHLIWQYRHRRFDYRYYAITPR